MHKCTPACIHSFNRSLSGRHLKSTDMGTHEIDKESASHTLSQRIGKICETGHSIYEGNIKSTPGKAFIYGDNFPIFQRCFLHQKTTC